MPDATPVTTPKPAPAPNGAAPPSSAPAVAGADSAAVEPKLSERTAALRDAARREQAKLRHREQERAERVALEARVKAAEEKAARADALEKELSEDALGVLSRRGVKARDLAERVVKEGTPDAAMDELRTKLAKVEAEREQERKDATARLQAAERERAVSDARKRLHATFAEMADEAPILTRICKTPERFEREYMTAWQAIQADPEAAKHQWTDGEIIVAMEAARRGDVEEAVDAFDAEYIEKLLTKKRTTAPVDGKTSQAGARQDSESARSGTTLTNGHSVSFSVPPNWDKLPEKEQNRLAAEFLRSRRR